MLCASWNHTAPSLSIKCHTSYRQWMQHTGSYCFNQSINTSMPWYLISTWAELTGNWQDIIRLLISTHSTRPGNHLDFTSFFFYLTRSSYLKYLNHLALLLTNKNQVSTDCGLRLWSPTFLRGLWFAHIIVIRCPHNDVMIRMFYALLALCEGNLTVPMNSLTKGQ